MTDIWTITHNSVYIQQALGTQGASEEWDKALTAYLLAFAQSKAEREVGDYAEAYQRHDWGRWRLEKIHGERLHQHPEAKEALTKLSAELRPYETAYCENFLKPLWEAARTLAHTPAPNLAATMFKLSLIEQEDLGNDAEMKREPKQLFDEDCDRLESANE